MTGVVEAVDQVAQAGEGVAIEAEPQAGEVGHVVVGELGLARLAHGSISPAHDDVGELLVERGELRVRRQRVQAQHEIAVDEAQRVVVAVEAW